MDYMYIAVKLVTGFFGLWLMTKLLGKKEISQLTPFDFVSSLMLSELVGDTVYDRDIKLVELFFALAVWTGLSLFLEKLIQRLPWLSGTLSGKPEILIRSGKIDEKVMKRNNLDMHQITMMLREQSVFSLRDVAYAIFETNGNISVLKTSAADSVTREDLQLPEQEVHLPVMLLDRGFVDEDALRDIGRDAAWLDRELAKQDVHSRDEVIAAEWLEGQGLLVQRR